MSSQSNATATNKKKIAIIGTAGVPCRYGGFETLAHQLVTQLAEQFQFTVYCSGKLYGPDERPARWKGARLVYLPLNANGIASVLYDVWSILHALFVAETLLLLGVSGGLAVPFVRLFTRKKVIVHIDGQEWRRGKWGKMARLFLKLSERVAVRFAHADIADNAVIKAYTARHYKTLSMLLAYGGDHASKQRMQPETLERFPFLKLPYAFKVARIEPENNIHTILEAFSFLPRHQLVLVGNWNNSAYGCELRERYAGHANLHLLDPIYEQQLLDQLRSNCHVYLHGHSAGGTNPSLVEAMQLGLPVVSIDVNFNRATTHNQAIYFKDVQELVQLVRRLSITELLNTGFRMKKLAQQHYQWSGIAAEYAGLFNAFDYAYTRKPLRPKVSRLGHKKLQQAGLAHLTNPATAIA